MILTVISWLYTALKWAGLWEKLLAEHKQREAANAQAEINRMDDATVGSKLRSKYTRD